MAAYPTTYVSRVSKATPRAGIAAEIADDDTIKFRRDQVSTHYDIRLLHEWLSSAERATHLAWITTNGFGPHTFTLDGVNFSGTLTNVPGDVDHRGDLYTLEAFFVAVAV